MEARRYGVFVQFDPKDRNGHERLREKLRKHIGCNEADLDRLLAKGSIALKRDTDFQMAVKIKDAFTMEGTYCTVVRQPAKDAPASVNSEPVGVQPAQGGVAVCPQCKRQQPASAECRYCGIIFAKIQPSNKGTRIPDASENQVPENSSISTEAGDESQTAGPIRNLFPKVQSLIQKIPAWQRSFHKWSRKPANAIIQLLILWIISLVLSIGQLLLGRMLWFVYRWSPTGTYYVSKYQERSAKIAATLEMDPLLLSFEITLSILIVCLLAAAIARATHMMRFFFTPLGFIGRLLFWCFPLAAVSAWLTAREYSHLPFMFSFLLAFFPVCILMNGCFRTVRVILPEIGTLTSAIGAGVPKWRQRASARLKKLLSMQQ